MAEAVKMPLPMTCGEKVKIVWEYGLDDLPQMMEQLDCLDKLQAIVFSRAEKIGATDITFLKLMVGTLRIAGNKLMDIRATKISPRPNGVSDQDN